MKKSKELIPIIMGAETREEAIEALRKTVEALHLSDDELHLISLKDRMNEFQAEFKAIVKRVKDLNFNFDSETSLELRLECNFLYQQISDEIVFEINKAKVLYEERKTIYRAEGLAELRNDEALLEELNPGKKKISDTALRDNLGKSKTYSRYTNRAGFSYGLYKEVHSLLEGINNLSNSLSSVTRHRQEVERRDAR